MNRLIIISILLVLISEIKGQKSGWEAARNPKRLKFYRYWNEDWKDHYYTLDYNFLQQGKHGFKLEKNEGYLLNEQQNGFVPLYQYLNGDNRDHFYGLQSYVGGGYKLQEIAGYCSPKQIAGTVPLYRLFHHTILDHMYTINKSDRDKYIGWGWKSEGIDCYVYQDPQ